MGLYDGVDVTVITLVTICDSFHLDGVSRYTCKSRPLVNCTTRPNVK